MNDPKMTIAMSDAPVTVEGAGSISTGPLESYGKSILDMGPKALRNRLKKLTENRQIFLGWIAIT